MLRQERLEALRDRVEGHVPDLAERLNVTPRQLRWAIRHDSNQDLIKKIVDLVIQEDATRNRTSKEVFSPLLNS